LAALNCIHLTGLGDFTSVRLTSTELHDGWHVVC
jgi:hypothetical protein